MAAQDRCQGQGDGIGDDEADSGPRHPYECLRHGSGRETSVEEKNGDLYEASCNTEDTLGCENVFPRVNDDLRFEEVVQVPNVSVERLVGC